MADILRLLISLVGYKNHAVPNINTAYITRLSRRHGHIDGGYKSEEVYDYRKTDEFRSFISSGLLEILSIFTILFPITSQLIKSRFVFFTEKNWRTQLNPTVCGISVVNKHSRLGQCEWSMTRPPSGSPVFHLSGWRVWLRSPCSWIWVQAIWQLNTWELKGDLRRCEYGH